VAGSGAHDRREPAAHAARSRQARLLEGAQRLLITLSEFPGLRGADPRECFPLLRNILRVHRDYFNVTVGIAP